MSENFWNTPNPQSTGSTNNSEATAPLTPQRPDMPTEQTKPPSREPGHYYQNVTEQPAGNYQQSCADYSYSHADGDQQNPKKRHTTGLVITFALLSALLGGSIGGLAATFASSSNGSSAPHTVAGTTIVNNTDSVTAVTAAAQKATPSVVTIGVKAANETGSGSGVVIDNQGHILTNTHVVTLGGKTAHPSIEVKLASGHVANASVVGTDPTSDLAVIKIDPSGLTLTPASLGDSGKLNVGDIAVAIGAPLGLDNTVTDGIISTLSRTIEVASSEAPESDNTESLQRQNSPFQFEIPGQNQQRQPNRTISINVLQTDAAVNPGNSGGALVNSAGELIGINVAIASADKSSNSASGNIGVGFSIPINYAKRIAQEIIDTGHASHGYLGASVSTSPANNDKSSDFGDGAVIRSVVSGKAAAQAGLREGDVITEFNGRKISEAGELTASVRQEAPGSTVTAKVQRGNKTEEVKITLGNSADAS